MMAEAAGLAIAVTSLLLQLRQMDKRRSNDYQLLELELQTFHKALVQTEHYLVQMPDIRTDCQELFDDIRLDICAHRGRNGLQRFTRAVFTESNRDIQTLIGRVRGQIGALTLFIVSMQRDQSVNLTAALNLLGEIWIHTNRQMQENTTFGLSTHIPANLQPLSVSTTPSVQSDSRPASIGFSSLYASSTDTLTSLSLSNVSDISSQQESFYPTQSATDASNRTKKTIGEILQLSDQLIHLAKAPEDIHVSVETVRCLLRQGASFEATDSICFRTPLIWAIINGRTDLVQLFLDEGADINTPDRLLDCACTPVIWAIAENKLEILRLLIERGADLLAKDINFDRTPILWAASFGNCDAAKLLLENNEKLIDAKDGKEMTPLALAYIERHWDMVCLCIEAGDDVTFRFECGTSLLDLARFEQDEELISLLLKGRSVCNPSTF